MQQGSFPSWEIRSSDLPNVLDYLGINKYHFISQLRADGYRFGSHITIINENGNQKPTYQIYRFKFDDKGPVDCHIDKSVFSMNYEKKHGSITLNFDSQVPSPSFTHSQHTIEMPQADFVIHSEIFSFCQREEHRSIIGSRILKGKLDIESKAFFSRFIDFRSTIIPSIGIDYQCNFTMENINRRFNEVTCKLHSQVSSNLMEHLYKDMMIYASIVQTMNL